MTDSQKTRLFIVRPTMGQGGAERVTLTLLQHLDRERFDVSLVLMRHEGNWLDQVPHYVRVHVLGSSTLWTAWFPLAKLLYGSKPDVLFSPGGTDVAAIIAKHLVHSPSRVVLSERGALYRGRRTFKRRLVVWFKRFSYPFADQLTAVSQGVKDEMVSVLGLAADRIKVIYNPIVDEKLEAQMREPATHPWFYENVPIILGVGRLVPEKDFAMLLRAFARVHKQRPVRLVILGEGPLRTNLIDLAAQLEVQDDVCLAGFDQNPFKYMSRCSVFVLSSRHEGLPGVLIQAMACGAPVISTDCPYGPAEIICEPGRDGILVPVGDAEAMADKIGYLVDHPTVAKEMGLEGQAGVCRFGVEKAVLEYTRLLENL